MFELSGTVMFVVMLPVVFGSVVVSLVELV